MKEIQVVLKEFAQLRKEMRIPIDVIQKTLQNDYKITVAVKTIYGWESGKMQPPLKTFIALCKIYKVNDIYALVEDESEIASRQTIKEHKLIRNYYNKRQYQEAIDRLLSL